MNNLSTIADSNLKNFLSRFEGMTAKEMQDQASKIRLYMMNQMFYGHNTKNEEVAYRFTDKLEKFLNRFWYAEQVAVLDKIHEPSEQDKLQYDFAGYQELQRQKMMNIKAMSRLSKTPDERGVVGNSPEEKKLKAIHYDLLQRQEDAPWGQFIDQLYKQHEQLTKIKEQHKITAAEIQLDNSSEAHALLKAYDNLKKQTIQEDSAMSAGSIEGGGKLFRDEETLMKERKDFVEELKLREHVRGLIQSAYNKILQEQKKELNEEQQLRETIQLLLKENRLSVLQEADEDVPHPTTGINVLEELLKKIIPVLETDYKTLTTSKEQRDSWRAHVINAIQTTLVTDRMTLDAPNQDAMPAVAKDDSVEDKAQRLKEKTSALVGGHEIKEPKSPQIKEGAGIDLENPTQEAAVPADVPADEDAFIDIEDKKEPEKKDTFTVAGMDMTGRNMALKSFEKIEKAIVDSYSMLSAEEDKEIFYDYLLANVKLYADRWEKELAVSTKEPTNPEYEKQKGQAASEETSGETAAKQSVGF